MINKEKLQKWIEIYPSISDLKKKAKKRIVNIAWEYLDSGTGDDDAVTRNSDDFKKIQLTPRFFNGSFTPEISTNLFGKKYLAPFGISPVGLTSLMWPKAEKFLAQTATRYSIPYSLSTLASATPEEIRQSINGNGFFQLYPPKGKKLRQDLLSRAKDNGFNTLLVTADVPTPARRERANRVGLRIPPKINFNFICQAIANLEWTMATFKNGLPSLKIMQKYASTKDLAKLSAFLGTAIEGSFSWDYLKEIRDEWQGFLVLKGILHPTEALKAVSIGFDGIFISNHGGRQFDCAPSSISVLEKIAKVVDGKAKIIFDSGIRSGLDIMKALILGADFVMAGRAFVYGVCALGEYGGDLVTEIFLEDLKVNMIQLGAKNLKDLKNIL